MLINNHQKIFVSAVFCLFVMEHSVKVGLSFGLCSGVITTLGLIVGLHSGTNSKLAVIGGILTIAVADSLSDALGIHISEEAENIHAAKEVWVSTFSTFFSKLFFALSFVIPVLLLDLKRAVIVSIIWGLGILSLFSFMIAKEQNVKPYRVIAEHLVIASSVIILSRYIGEWIAITFG